MPHGLRFVSPETLEYGELQRRVVNGFEDWTKSPVALVSDQDWTKAFAEHTRHDFLDLWNETIVETRLLLDQIGRDLDEGPLNNSALSLQKLGCQDPKTNGSGTISAVAALFLASRFSASPRTGLLEATSLRGADTDTLGSMTATLLGATHGTHWLHPLIDEIEDSDYLQSISRQLARLNDDSPRPSDRVGPQQEPNERVTKSRAERWLADIADLHRACICQHTRRANRRTSGGRPAATGQATKPIGEVDLSNY